jgi:hypothetical protein
MYFADVDEGALAEVPADALRCIRQMLQASSPANVVPQKAWWRGEGPGGGDFVIPHSAFDGFAIVVRVGDISRRATVAYASYTRRDRGDPFDAAFDRNQDIIAGITYGISFCDDLTEVLRTYLRRRLCVIQEVGQGEGPLFQTRVLWPKEDPPDHAITLWKQRAAPRLLRAREEKRWFTTFD